MGASEGRYAPFNGTPLWATSILWFIKYCKTIIAQTKAVINYRTPKGTREGACATFIGAYPPPDALFYPRTSVINALAFDAIFPRIVTIRPLARRNNRFLFFGLANLVGTSTQHTV